MFSRVLIGNRGEIAVRIIRTCRELGIETVVAASKADVDSMAARMADRQICIGPPAAADSYLRGEALIMAARATACEAIHPGYGFLAESADFARMCQAHGLVFVGPAPRILDEFGDKVRSRALAESAGVPLLPGSELLESVEQALGRAADLGYPVLLKPAHGGGGKGMRVIRDASHMRQEFDTATAESRAAFGSGDLFAERWVARARHVEVQIAGDGSGSAVHLGDRDCTVQRRHQKLVEEAPAPFLASELQAAMRAAARDLAAVVRYDSIGTVEFLVDPERGEFSFLEVNPRIQVEHGVTELVTGIDLVELQLRLAAGERALPEQDSISMNGSALQCRINAEDPTRDFAPSPGRVRQWAAWADPDVRIDTHMAAGAMVSPFYDSLIAKVMTRSAERAGAISLMLSALDGLTVEGVSTTRDLARWIVGRREFEVMQVHTRWLDEAIGAFVAGESNTFEAATEAAR